jgi:hypothetical protein
MTSADFFNLILSTLVNNSTMARLKISPGKTSYFHTYTCHIYSYTFRVGVGTLKIIAFLSSVDASYVIPVRQVSALPAASFKQNFTALLLPSS